MERIMSKDMFLRKGGKAVHQLGDVSRNVLDAELIYVYNEDDENYIGQFAEGYGFFDIKFRKSDCREATVEEVELCEHGRMSEIKF